MMKRILTLFTVLTVMQSAFAQSAYISYRPFEQGERIADLQGNGGILIVSKRNDLVITVVNAPESKTSAAQQRPDGLFEYEVVVDKNKVKEAKIEVNRRGDIDRLDWVVSIKADYFRAYLIEETAKPIRMENQTAANDAILDASLAQVEFQTTIPDLVVDCQELVNRGAIVKKDKKKGDNSIIITSVTIPIKILDTARQKWETARNEHQTLYNKLVNSSNAPANEWERLDVLKAEEDKAEEEYKKLTLMNVYATGTNQLPVDISSLKPRSKMVYGVLLRTIIEEKHVSECAGFMAEGGRQFSLREYENARRAFTNALSAKDTPKDLIPTIQTSISQCDSCVAYTKYTLGALAKIRELKALGGGTQMQLVDYASAAIEYLQVLNRYNPCDFYNSRVAMLEKIIADLPLEIRFTMVRWVNNYEGFFEAGKIPHVEIYAFSGGEVPAQKKYKTDKDFVDLMGKSNNFRQLGVSDDKGQVDIQLDRKNLPVGFFFRPVGYDNKIKIAYFNTNELLKQTEGTYNKRRIRLKMYAAY